MPDVLLCQGTALALPLKDASVHVCCTSPPYFGLRSYNCGPGELGLEDSPDAYIAAMVQVFREVKRVLHPNGTIWINMGDSYAGGNQGGAYNPATHKPTDGSGGNSSWTTRKQRTILKTTTHFPAKSLMGMPWRLAFRLQEDGWILRSAITWCKAAPMPESVTDRPTSATEMVFLFAKQPHYFYDATAVRVQTGNGWHGSSFTSGHDVATKAGLGQQPRQEAPGRNLWNYWILGPEPSSFAHYACMPTALVRRCLLAGVPSQVCAACSAPYRRVVERGDLVPDSPGYRPRGALAPDGYVKRALHPAGTQQGHPNHHYEYHTTGFSPTCACAARTARAVVLDPFCGSGTVPLVARELGHHAVGLDLSYHYLSTIARERLGLAALANWQGHGDPPPAEDYTALPLFGGG